MKFRIKGTEQILVFRATIDGDLVLRTEGDESRYIDTYFEGDHVPELEILDYPKLESPIRIAGEDSITCPECGFEI